ncbi:MAG TPA: toll/interleukin-1 receptor domain-containing protein [Longimicrobium sp.]|nr:toll/interleukin-1 receptor domain-containing protein [Longimicrobium sp.]
MAATPLEPRRGLKVFISHAGRDTWVALRIAEKIRELGARTFLDETDIAIGEDFEARILKEIQSCDEFLVLLTPWSLDREYVLSEIGAAAVKCMPIIGVVYGWGADELGAKLVLPPFVGKRNLVDLNDLDRYLRELARRIEAGAGGGDRDD